VERAIFFVPPVDKQKMLPILDQHAGLIATVA